MFPPDALRAAVVAPLARARLALIDCGHEIPIEAPRELAALIEAFLAGLGERHPARRARASRAPWGPSQASARSAG